MVDTVKKTVGHLEDLVLKQRERDARQRDLVSEWQRKVPLPYAVLLFLLMFGDARVTVIYFMLGPLLLEFCCSRT